MKKATLLHSEISYVISKLGHTDSIAIGDCGLPISDQVQRIDLAVIKGLPGLLPVLGAVLTEQSVERVTIAEETRLVSPAFYQGMMALIARAEAEQNKKIEVTHISHEAFKSETQKCKAVIRTGEATPYANIILHAGVTF